MAHRSQLCTLKIFRINFSVILSPKGDSTKTTKNMNKKEFAPQLRKNCWKACWQKFQDCVAKTTVFYLPQEIVSDSSTNKRLCYISSKLLFVFQKITINYQKISPKIFLGLNFLVIVANLCSKTKQRSCIYGGILNSSNSRYFTLCSS